MIFVLFFVALMTLAILCAIVYLIKGLLWRKFLLAHNEHIEKILTNSYIENFKLFSFVALCLLAPSLFFGVMAIHNNSNANCEQVKEKWNERALELCVRRKLINQYEENDYKKYFAVTKYNEDVKNFYEELNSRKEDLDNLFTNWLTCKAYAELDYSDVVDYIEINWGDL